ncbi:MAG: Gfo/Idh/MocA family protein [Myxococcota bacterium]
MSGSDALRVGVVGVGHMGRLHAAKLVERSREEGDVRLVGVSDQDRERADAVASELSVPVVPDARALLRDVDAVIVAVPTVAHFDLCSAALAGGVDVLVEKPISVTVDEADRMVELARGHGRVLQVGHQEWFNSAMRVVRERIVSPRFAEIHRMGPFPERSTDVDVVRDLMIHDIEILQQLLGKEPERVDAVGVPVLTNHPDIANARLTFPDFCVANLTASRVSPTPMRKFRLFQRDAYFSIDFLEQKAILFRRLPRPDGPPKIEFEQLETDPGDALQAQLGVFVEAVRTRSAPREDGQRGISGAEAAAALRTALRVIDAMPPIEGLD